MIGASHRRAPVVSLRLTNCYGPRLRIRDARQTFLGIWMRCVLEDKPFEVWGGAQLRDLTYVDDVTDGIPARGGDARLPWQDFQHRRLAARRSLLEIAEPHGADRRRRRAVRDAGIPADRARIDIGSYHADDHAFRAATGWAPKVALEEGIRRSLDWYRPRLAAYL